MDGVEVMQKFGVTGAIDIAGFGLIWHALEKTKASKVNVKINAKNVPLLYQSYEMVDCGCFPFVAFENLR